MRRRYRFLLLLAIAPAAYAQVATPTLRWAYKGACTPGDCETGWYSSPAVADLDGDGLPEVIAGQYTVSALDSATGATRWSGASTKRVWPGIVVADLDGDGRPEVVVGRESNSLTVYSYSGGVRSGWPIAPFASGEVRAVAVADLDGDGQAEIVAAAAAGGGTARVSVFAPNGAQRAGWPRPQAGDAGTAAGVYNDDIGLADFNRDGLVDIFVPTDVHYILGLQPNGTPIAASPVFGANKTWAQIGLWVNQADELAGGADCNPGVKRPNLAASAPAIGDVDGDGQLELVVVGNAYDCSVGDPDGDLFHLPWIYERDRTRFNASGFDWRTLPAPKPNSAPKAHGDFATIEDVQPSAVLADLDGDGRSEILYSSYDGRVHAWWLDRTEHGAWPYVVPGPGGYAFASEPVVADLDLDGHAEVIFATIPQKAGGSPGALVILDYQGHLLQSVPLPAPRGDTWNGGLAAPTLAVLAGSPNLQVILTTHASGIVDFELPNTRYVRTQWPTGRGGLHRRGVAENDRIFADGYGGRSG